MCHWGQSNNNSVYITEHNFQIGDFQNGIAALAKERSKWLSRPDLCVRAARHYEGAASIFIRHAVMTVKEVSVKLFFSHIFMVHIYILKCSGSNRKKSVDSIKQMFWSKKMY